MLDQPPEKPQAKPHHAGHRERLRERARGAGIHHLPDYELLELFLFRSQPQGDVKPIAKALLTRFGSLAAVLAASVEDLMTVRAEDSRGRSKGVGAETALDLAALHEVSRRVAKEEANKRTVISSRPCRLDSTRNTRGCTWSSKRTSSHGSKRFVPICSSDIRTTT